MSKGFGPDELLACYARGTFPMADGRDDPRLFLVDPDQRGILPLDQVHIPRRLKRTVRTTPYVVTINQAFREVVELCAAPSGERTETWINQPILELYDGLHRRGHGFSFEAWHEGDLVGGLYGVRLGAAFFGESMFSRARDASKIALVHLVAHLIAGGFRLLDTQFLTDHLTQFGTLEVNRKTYHMLLAEAITCPSTFPVPGLLVPEPQEQDLSAAQTHLDLPPAQPVPMPLHLDLPRPLCLQSAGALCLETIELHLAAQLPLHN
ncbi:MAG TPA: leucyl/phenylalanyl-tRNA--protein transferase [Hyphomonadaceae bacterium]|nr:leucyl/phenylalanyl-tRNA--protein transferase [Hyphomonadaceae bacterium]